LKRNDRPYRAGTAAFNKTKSLDMKIDNMAMSNIVERVEAADIDMMWRDLVHEVRELHAEIERLQQECARLASERACLEIDVGRLRAEVEYMRKQGAIPLALGEKT
jgi:predicted nuclease with TOPRIM domain